jgi:DeoR family transcriptional regulator, fructose operon transcriptional repressor
MSLADGRRAAGAVGERRWAILEVLERERSISVHKLRQRFGLSEVSIRRDLDYLARHGLIQRVRGGARALTRTSSGGVFEARLLRNTEAKRAIAAEAVKLIGPGDSVLFDSGTTVLAVARALPVGLCETGTLTLMTRSLSIATELRRHRNIRLVVLGGVYASDFDSFVGHQVERALEVVRIDKLFIGADGIDEERGLTTDNLLESQLFRQMARAAGQVIVAADSSKIGQSHLEAILGLAEIHTFVTDADCSVNAAEKMRSAGIEVLIAPALAAQERNS